MVVAYLRGLLRPIHKFGSRSVIAENVVLEALSAELLAGNMQAVVSSDLAAITLFKQDAAISTMELASSRLTRAGELRIYDVYKVASQIAGQLKRDTKDELSMFQLYQIAEKSGIFEALDRNCPSSKATPLF
jgi:hypothetical protein